MVILLFHIGAVLIDAGTTQQTTTSSVKILAEAPPTEAPVMVPETTENIKTSTEASTMMLASTSPIKVTTIRLELTTPKQAIKMTTTTPVIAPKKVTYTQTTKSKLSFPKTDNVTPKPPVRESQNDDKKDSKPEKTKKKVNELSISTKKRSEKKSVVVAPKPVVMEGSAGRSRISGELSVCLVLASLVFHLFLG